MDANVFKQSFNIFEWAVTNGCSQSSPDSGRSQLLPHVIYNQVVFGKKDWLLLNLAKRLVFFGAIFQLNLHLQ